MSDWDSIISVAKENQCGTFPALFYIFFCAAILLTNIPSAAMLFNVNWLCAGKCWGRPYVSAARKRQFRTQIWVSTWLVSTECERTLSNMPLCYSVRTRAHKHLNSNWMWTEKLVRATLCYLQCHWEEFIKAWLFWFIAGLGSLPLNYEALAINRLSRHLTLCWGRAGNLDERGQSLAKGKFERRSAPSELSRSSAGQLDNNSLSYGDDFYWVHSFEEYWGGLLRQFN